MEEFLSNFNENNLLVQLIFAYIAGFLTSLTPCVYPLIPITIAVFGAKKDTPRKKSFLLSLVYVLGIAFSYTVLGLIAATSGNVFGQFLGNPIFSFVIFVFLLTLGLLALDVLNLQSLSKLQTWAANVGGSGYKGAFTMGSVSGIVAAPCVGPILVMILGVVAATGNLFTGAILLFSYSIGLGTLFIFLATYSNLIHKIPKSGNWLNIVKFIIGCLVIYFALKIQNFISLDFIYQAIAGNLSIVLVVIGVFLASFAYKIANKKLVLVAALITVVSANAIDYKQIHTNYDWYSSYSTGRAVAQKNEQIMLVDLTAEWCAACKQLEEETFAAEEVQGLMGQIVKIKLDFTEPNGFTEAFSKKYDVLGLPCVLFLKPNEEEIKDTRITGFIKAEEFKEILSKVLKD